MSSELLKRVALFTRDLLGHDEQLIRLGRENFERGDFDRDYIVIDSQTRADRTASLEDYDGDTEKLALGEILRATVTLDFYGPDAYARAREFRLRTRSQAALELRRTHGIEVHQPAGITDLKALTGQTYGERQRVEATVEISEALVIDTLRIDTARTEIRNEDGVFHNG